MPTVLIVDDDRFTRTVLETIFAQDRTFSDLDLSVVTAGNGDEGIQAFREHGPQVVIVDLLMPRVDGFEVCRQVRAEPSGRDTSILVMSGVYRDNAVAQRLKSEYGAEFFAKPQQLKEMTGHVAELLRKPDGAASQEIVIEALPPDDDAKRALASEVSTGELALRRLPAVLFDLLEARATGVLQLRRGRITKMVELESGHPCSVSSTMRDETLGHFLVAAGIIDDTQHQAAVKRAQARREKVGQALIALGALTPEQLVEQLAAQTRHKLVQALRWPDGAWRFEPSEHASVRGQTIDMIQTVLTGLTETATLDAVPRQVANVAGEPLELTERGTQLLPTVRRLLSTAFADAWTDGITVPQLLDAGVQRRELYPTLEALMLCDAVRARLPAVGPALSARPKSDSEGSGDYSVRELSEESAARREPRRATGHDTDELYAMLFDEPSALTPMPGGELPLEVDDDDGVPVTGDGLDSGVIDVRAIGGGVNDDAETAAARRMLIKEFLRIQGQDHYGVIGVDRKAIAQTVSAAIVEKRSKFSFEWFARFDLGRDYAKLEQLHAAYDRAFETLLDDERRAAYDREQAGGELVESAPTLDAEIAFRGGEDLLARGHFDAAIRKLEDAVRMAPDESDYHAALGWAHYLRGERSGRAADVARPHLNRALSVNSEHAAANEYKGIITAELGNDDVEAIAHLDRALESDPHRTDALLMLEDLRRKSGELRPLERTYRRLIYRAAGRDAQLELRLWLKLGELYRTELDEPGSARIAFESAARIAPDDPAIQAALADLDSGSADRFFERSEMLRGHWRRDPASEGPGIELWRAALQAERFDAAYMAASALVARDAATEEIETYYLRYRPRFVVRAQRRLEPELWNQLRHPDDSPELGALFELIAPALRAAMPLSLAELEVDDAMEVGDAELPLPFVKVRAYVAHILGVGVPRVYVRPDFGHQIHVGALEPPILLAGDDALVAPERAELSFRLGRAMTYLWPGRAVGGSRPSRALKAAVLAVFASSNPSVAVDDPGRMIDPMVAALDVLSPEVRAQAQRIVSHLTAQSSTLNLTRWARSLARTADRVGLLLCGDLPAAVRFLRDSGSDHTVDDLIDFALSSRFLSLRQQVGVSIDV